MKTLLGGIYKVKEEIKKGQIQFKIKQETYNNERLKIRKDKEKIIQDVTYLFSRFY